MIHFFILIIGRGGDPSYLLNNGKLTKNINHPDISKLWSRTEAMNYACRLSKDSIYSNEWIRIGQVGLAIIQEYQATIPIPKTTPCKKCGANEIIIEESLVKCATCKDVFVEYVLPEKEKKYLDCEIRDYFKMYYATREWNAENED